MMSKKQYIIVFGVMLLIMELITIKLFYTTDALINFRSMFWILHITYVLIFLMLNHFSIKEELGYYDVFLVLFPFVGALIMLIDFSLCSWRVEYAIVNELLYPELLNEMTEKKSKLKEEEYDVMSAYDYFSFSEVEIKNYTISKINKLNADLVEEENEEYEEKLREAAERAKTKAAILEYFKYLYSRNKFKEIMEKYKEFKSKGIEVDIPNGMKELLSAE